MKRRKRLGLIFALILAGLPPSLPGAEAPGEATHNELRALRDGLLAAINQGDLERELTYLHPNAVITWHNAEVSRGREGVRAYYNRLMHGPDKLVDRFSTEIAVDELTILHGENTGISFGSSVEHFTLTNGSSFDLKGRWTTTLVRENGHWLVASLHVSTNIFDNVMLDLAKKYTLRAAGLGLLIGAILGWLIGRRRKAAA